MSDYWLFAVIVWVSFGIVGAVLAERKDRPPVLGLVVGVALGVFGAAIIAILPRELPRAPEGMYALQCRRCNAVQNLTYGDEVFECWRCDHTENVDALLGGEA